MKAHTLLAVVAIASLVSCAGLVSPSTQAKIDQAGQKYESATGVSVAQTGSLLFKWYGDLQSTREANKLLKTPPIPLGPVQATQASPVMDYTSAKAVLEGIQQASVIPSSGWRQPAADPATHDAAPQVRPRPSRRPDANHPQQLASLTTHPH